MIIEYQLEKNAVSQPIGPGDWVECVGASGPVDNSKSYGPARGDKPARGQIYRVDRIDKAINRDGQIFEALTLVAPKAWSERGREIGWRVAYFRPVYRPKQSVIDSLKAPPARTPEPA